MSEMTSTKTDADTTSENPENGVLDPEHQPIDDFNTSAVAVAGFLGGMLTVAIIVALQVMYYYFKGYEDMQKQRGLAAPTATLTRAEQLNQLERFGWINRQDGTVLLTVDQAARTVIQQLRTEEQAEAEQRAEGESPMTPESPMSETPAADASPAPADEPAES